MTTSQNNYSDFLKKNKIFKHSVNGLSRFLILWIIRFHYKIHGYGILKELDKFFETSINEGVLKPSSSSKIYSLLNEMEKSEVIVSKIEMNDNKKVKYYFITEKGDFLLNYLFERFVGIFENPQWQLLLNDFEF